MSKVLKRLYLGDVVKSFGTKQLRKLTTEEPITIVPYLTFTSPNSFTLNTYNTKKNWDGELEYSTDTNTWNVWDGTTTLSADSGKLYLRGTGNTIIGTNRDEWSYDWVCSWVINGTDIDCKGNIENLLDYTTVINGKHPPMSKDCYRGMFDKCTSLKTAPELPATTLTECCYRNMFYNCTSLTSAPELPATTLDRYCYYNMFYNCTSLTSAPELPATTLDRYCYSYMFYNCTSLTAVPELPATTLAEGCYSGMFFNCTSLTAVPELPATTLAEGCYNRMFNGCTSIKLSTTQTGEYQTPYRIPTSGSGTTATNALFNMFNNTGGTFTGTPSINTTYYTSNTVV